LSSTPVQTADNVVAPSAHALIIGRAPRKRLNQVFLHQVDKTFSPWNGAVPRFVKSWKGI